LRLTIRRHRTPLRGCGTRQVIFKVVLPRAHKNHVASEPSRLENIQREIRKSDDERTQRGKLALHVLRVVYSSGCHRRLLESPVIAPRS